MLPEGVSAGYFGKAPFAADFIAENASSPLGAAFQQWLLDGVGLARERMAQDWTARYESAPPIRFLFRLAGGTGTLAGSLVTGHDRSGRQFPLAIFAEVGGSGVPASDLADRTDLYLSATRLGDSAGAADAQALKAGLAGVWGEARPCAEPARGVVDSVGGPSALGRIGANLLALEPRAARGAAGFDGFFLRFPMPVAAAHRDACVSLWGGLCRAFLGALANRVSVFWTESGRQPAFLDVHPGDPSVLSYLLLLQPELEMDAIYPMTETPASPERARHAAEAAERILDGDPVLGAFIPRFVAAVRDGGA